jgi:hypothetical protein
MENVARIIGVWIVGCMIVGGALLIANVPGPQEVWTDQRLWLARLGGVAIALGALGILAEVWVLWRSWRIRQRPSTPTVAPVRSDAMPWTQNVQNITTDAPILPPAVRDTGERIVVDVTPDYLWGLFEGRTTLQGDALVQPYMGKWMSVEGPMGDMAKAGNSLQVTFAYGTHPTMNIVFMHVRAQKWIDRFSVVKLGDHMVALGRIERVSAMYIHLEDCELVSSNTRPTPIVGVGS